MAHTITLPGIGGSGETHWQTLWEKSDPNIARFAPADWNSPDLADWVEALDHAVAASDAPPLLVAHSLSCLLVAHWHRTSRRAVAGAFLVAVPDPQSAAFPAEAAAFGDVPAEPFRFPSLVIASSNDPFGTLDYARRRAREWGSGLVEVGALGHINGKSGLGAWPSGLALLHAFAAGTTRRPVRVARGELSAAGANW